MRVGSELLSPTAIAVGLAEFEGLSSVSLFLLGKLCEARRDSGTSCLRSAQGVHYSLLSVHSGQPAKAGLG